jgi:hypothetical protein
MLTTWRWKRPESNSHAPPLHHSRLDRGRGVGRGAPVALHVAQYNFCRRHSTLRMTPAVAANGSLWSLEDLYERVMG